MQMPILDDLLAAFEEVREQARSGGPWRPRDAEQVVEMVTNRGEALGGHLRQLARLVRLAALSSRHVYLEFFEVAVRSARPKALGDVIARGLREHGVPPARITLEGDRLLFHETAMQPPDGGGRAFEIGLGQIGRLAALHHVLCRFLHYPRLFNSQAGRNPRASDDERGLLWPLCTAEPGCGADEIARRLQSALNAHLTRVFESTSHTARQVQTITGFLKSRIPEGGLSTAPSDLVDNRLLLEFWESAALSGEEGFKLYRSAVTKMLRYRRALTYALAEFGAHLSIGSGGDGGEIDLDRLETTRGDDTTGYGATALETGRWQSPMVALSPLLRIVKVLNDTECRQLANFLNGCTDGAADDEEGTDDEAQPDSGAIPDFRSALNREFARPFGSALLGDDRFDLRLTRTLLRVDVFDPCQRAIGPKAERGDMQAVAAVLADIGEASYRDREQAYSAIREQLVKGMYASLYILGSLGEASALVLMARLCERPVVDRFVGGGDAAGSDEENDPLSEGRREDITARLKTAFLNEGATEDQSVRDLVRRTKSAMDQVRRKGFKREQWSAGSGIGEALAEASGDLVRLLDEVDRLLAALRRFDKPSAASAGAGLTDAATEDRAAFAGIFERIYPTAASGRDT